MRWITRHHHHPKLLLTFFCFARLASWGRADVDIVCDELGGNQIDWDCIFGSESLTEANERGGKLTTCPDAYSSRHPCSLFVVPKEGERSEVKVTAGPEGFPFQKNEKYVFKYSFRPKKNMKVGKQYTHFGQIKGDKSDDGTSIIKGVPIYSLTANTSGLMVRFSNLKTIENFHQGLEKFLPWDDTLSQWVHVKITTTLGKSMTVEISGAVEGTAEWPDNLSPIAWHSGAEMVRMKLGLYHKTNQVADGEVEYRKIRIKGPNGQIRTSPRAEPAGSLYRGCFEDKGNDRVLDEKKIVDAHMTNELCEELCEGYEYFGTQAATECFCGDSSSRLYKHGKAKNCNMDCPGSSRIENCGGPLAISVFQYEGSPSDIPKNSDYLGCFADKGNDRALTLDSTTSAKNMTYAKCRTFCNKKGANYFGLQFSNECFCGKSKDDYDQHGEAICYMECAGDSDAICGGYGTMNVFRIT